MLMGHWRADVSGWKGSERSCTEEQLPQVEKYLIPDLSSLHIYIHYLPGLYSHMDTNTHTQSQEEARARVLTYQRIPFRPESNSIIYCIQRVFQYKERDYLRDPISPFGIFGTVYYKCLPVPARRSFLPFIPSLPPAIPSISTYCWPLLALLLSGSWPDLILHWFSIRVRHPQST